MFESLLETLGQAYQLKRHRKLLAAIWKNEVWFDTPHQLKAAQVVRQALLDAGIANARIDSFPADGATHFQDWTAAMAWECTSAQLAIEGGEVLANRKACPLNVVYWSGPLASARKPAVGEVVDGDAIAQITPEAVAGKFVLTAKMPAEIKRRLIAAGCFQARGQATETPGTGTNFAKDAKLEPVPLAIVSDFLGKGIGYTDDTVRWCNTWSDGPDGWFFHAHDVPLAGFMISPAAGKLLRQKMAQQPGLKLSGFCSSKLHAGSGQAVTGMIEGTDPSREVWLIGHSAEQGAQDNAAGVAMQVEALAAIRQAVIDGKLPPPRYSIRMVTSDECLGMIAWVTLHDDVRRRALAALNLDGPGGPAPADHPFNLAIGPMSNPSISWAAAGMIASAVTARARGGWNARLSWQVPSADDMISDPHCGIPAMWLGPHGDCSNGYHSSADTPEGCPDESLRNSTIFSAAWAYTLATMDDAVAGAFLPAATAWIDANILRQPLPDGKNADAVALTRWAAGKMIRDLARWGVSQSVYESAAARYAPADAPPLPDLTVEGPRFMRRTWGTCTFETLPDDKRQGLSRWSNWQTAALYWNDGRRPLAALERLVKAECGNCPPGGLAKLFQACLEAGLLVQDNSKMF